MRGSKTRGTASARSKGERWASLVQGWAELPPDPAQGTPDDAYERFRAILGEDQLKLVDDEAPLVAACWGRRSGKTVSFIGKDLKIRRGRPNARVCYFAPSDEQGVDILWEELREYNRAMELGYSEHWSEREWRRTGGRIEVLGFNTRKDVERARGRYYDLVRIDEAQLAPDWFTKVAEAAIFPTILDYRGQVEATGTPTPVNDGFFFEACHDTLRWSNEHYSNCNRNPFFAKAGRDGLAEAREMFKLAEDSPTYLREWLAQWIVDADELVYVIPEAAIVPGNGQWYGHAIGLDLGWRDHDAIGVMGVNPLRTQSHLRHMETKGQQTNHQLFRRLLELAEKFPGPTIRDQWGDVKQSGPVVVYDPAGHATKKTIETFRSDAPAIHWVQADKREKVQSIEWLNNDLREGTTTVEPGCSMIREAKRLRWKRPGKLAEDADHSDQGDAWLYPWRHVRDWLRRVPTAKPVAKDESPFDEYLRRMRAQENEQGRGGYFATRAKEVG